jgi:tetratricopeptide (TPR) repeat protein
MARALALVALVAWAAQPARAEGPSPLWDDVVHPGRPRCSVLLVDARKQLAARQLDGAIALLRDGAHRCPDDFETLSLFGVALARAGNVAEARWALEKARALAPADERDAQLAYWLGYVRVMAGDLAGSLEELSRADALGLDSQLRPLLHYNLGDVLMALGRLSEAIDAYRRAANLGSGDVALMARLALAVALDRDQQAAESRNELRKVLRFDPLMRRLYSGQYWFVPPADAHYYVALAEQTRGQLATARAELRVFLAMAPDSPYAARAREHLERAAGLDERELKVTSPADAARAAAVLAPLMPELERCLEPVPLPIESTTVVPPPPVTWVRLTRLAGHEYLVSAPTPTVERCLGTAVARARLPPDALGTMVSFPLAAQAR